MKIEPVSKEGTESVHRVCATVFISHASRERFLASDVCAALEKEGISCWMAPRDVMAGRPYSGQITEAIRDARVLLLILSRESNFMGPKVSP